MGDNANTSMYHRVSPSCKLVILYTKATRVEQQKVDSRKYVSVGSGGDGVLSPRKADMGHKSIEV